MTLRDTVFFPQAILPLYIFEPRYRQMLRDVLAGNRLFAVVRLDEAREDAGEEEPCCGVATVGIVRAAQANPDGTSNLVLQGLYRVRVEAVESDEPYRTLRISPLETVVRGDPTRFDTDRERVLRLLHDNNDPNDQTPTEFCDYLKQIDDPSAFLDLTVHAACPCPDMKQRLLETLSLEDRYATFVEYLERRLEQRHFFRTLQGGTLDDQIPLN